MEPTPAFPRLTLSELEASLRLELEPITSRLGYFGDYFAVVGRNAKALHEFLEYTKAVKAPLSDRHNEVLALVTCTATGAEYERIQHEWLSHRLGFPREWIAELTGRPAGTSTLLDQDEQALRNLAKALVERQGVGAAAEIEAVRCRLGEQAALAAVLQVSRFMLLSVVMHAFRMPAPVVSLFDAPDCTAFDARA